MKHRFNRKVIATLALGGLAVTVSAASLYFRKKIEDRIGNMELCKTSLQYMLKHKPSIELLEEPITWRRPSLQNTYNRITKTTANIAVPISGAKESGDLLISASRQETDEFWTLEALKLKVKDKEIVIK